ncbi:hypothetical protein S1OALGB6SA_1080 [Olavius algarvensis spirochete endosymbiont]|uniref:bactofilin family protein n=1 Tax=Olavius algarvensis spirochete endosymbiont TaxID=260710 RepID=UPI00052BFF71|nr:polymer-forming cytoskeletal protein [Olavius algarvensis spirochete endosymbiont]KGM43259.1 hypothetical protein JY97_08565 [Alkalispirochaeta odontotermitis]VDB00007.1 hypothetical protein S1OALGB6SA_1080 [Olavius algarvensis spirochete endosymbiont]
MPYETETLETLTVLGEETDFNGVLRFQHSLEIDGKFKGTIESTGFLLVEEGAEIVANINVGTLVVRGLIKGDVIAGERLEILDGGEIIGDIRCTNLVMLGGSSYRGRCEMLANPIGIDVFSMSKEMLKRTISRVE